MPLPMPIVKSKDDKRLAWQALKRRKSLPSLSGVIRKLKFNRAIHRLMFIVKLRRAAKQTKQHVANDDRADFIPQSHRRRFLFDDNMFKKNVPIKELMKEDRRPKEDFRSVVDGDIQGTERYVSKELVGGLISSAFFRIFIFVLIIVNSVIIGVQTNTKLAIENRFGFFIFDQSVLATFIVEILLKWFYGFWIFWKEGWNVLDFAVVLALILGTQLSFLASSRILRILRVMRAFRSLRSINALAGLSTVVQAIITAIPDMANIVLLLFIILLVFAIAGVTLFGRQVPNRFGDLWSALFSLFICVTQDGWIDMHKDFWVADILRRTGAVYFCVLITIGAFVFVNLVVAVVVTNLELAMREMAAEKNATDETVDKRLVAYRTGAEQSVDRSINHGDDGTPQHVARIIRYETFVKTVDWKRQTPLQRSGLTSLTVQNLTQYMFVLTALEENLAEYKNIKQDIEDMHKLVKDLNDEDAQEAADTTPAPNARMQGEGITRGADKKTTAFDSTHRKGK